MIAFLFRNIKDVLMKSIITGEQRKTITSAAVLQTKCLPMSANVIALLLSCVGLYVDEYNRFIVYLALRSFRSQIQPNNSLCLILLDLEWTFNFLYAFILAK